MQIHGSTAKKSLTTWLLVPLWTEGYSAFMVASAPSAKQLIKSEFMKDAANHVMAR